MDGLNVDLRGDLAGESVGLHGDFCGEAQFSLSRRLTGFFLGDLLFTGDIASLTPFLAG